MTDTPALPASEPALIEPASEPTPPPAPPRQATSPLPVLCAGGFILLAGAIGYVWAFTIGPYAPTASGELQALTRQLQTLSAKVAQLEKVPDVSARVDALERRPSAVDVAAIASRVVTLEQRAALESQLGGRYDSLAARVDALSAKTQSDVADLSHRVDAIEGRLGALSASAQQVSGLNDRAVRLARIQAATAALLAGQKLGALPGAPPALAKYATTAPPTEAELRLSYPAVAQAAMEASRPDTAGQPFLDRVWTRAQTLVTVRDDDDVIIGDAASGVLAKAHTALEAGDLAGAVTLLSTLKGPAAAALAHWLGDAKSLLAARTALTDLAGQS